ncbi:MAG: hypothetical protein LBI71_09830 [Enterobacteriaceae bacterium]|jgi:hypothetical protein|nr:hypothetical protein [Enterobacteriaceae bacterium]
MDNDNIKSEEKENNFKDKNKLIPEVRAVGSLAVIKWISSGWHLFAAKPMKWMLIALIYFSIFLFIAVIGIAIPLIKIVSSAIILSLIAGFFVAIDKQIKTGDFEIKLLFSGFNKLGSMFGIVLISFIIYFLISIILAIPLILYMIISNNGSESIINTEPSAIMYLFIFVIAIFIFSISSAISLFAPILIIIYKQDFARATLMSLKALIKNPISCVFISSFMFFILPLSIMFFGIGLLIALPIFMATVYTACRSIFYIEETDDIKII